MILSSRILGRSLIAAALLCLIATATAILTSDARTRQMAANSLVLAAGACAIAVPLGAVLAVMLVRTNVWGRPFVTVLLGALLFLPLYVQLSGWDALGGKNGWFTLAFGSVAEPLLDGMTAAIWIHAMAAAPWVALIVGVGLQLVEPELEEAALIDAAPLVVLLRVTLPQTLPFLLAAAVWVCISTTSEMTVTNIYLVSTYTEELYLSLALSPDASEAGLQVLPGIALIVSSLLLTLGSIAWLSPQLARVSPRGQHTIPLNGHRKNLSLLLWSLVLLLVGVPVVSLAYKAGVETSLVDSNPVRHWSFAKFSGVVGSVPRHFFSEFRWTAIIATAAASGSVVIAVALAWLARFGGWRMIPAIAITTLGLAVPGPLVAVAIILLLNQPSSTLLVWLYDRTIAAPLLAQMVRALPVAIVLTWQAFRKISDETLAAASLDGARRWKTLLHIILPQRKAALGAAWLASFAIAAGDLGYSLLVILPGMDTIQRRIFGLVHSGVEEQVAGVCLVMVLAYLFVAAGISSLLRGSSRD